VNIRAVGIVAKSGLHAATPHLAEIGAWLEGRGVEAVYETETAALMARARLSRSAVKSDLVRQVDLVVVLGGDGTLLGMADCIGEQGAAIPILGVNFGSLGFLTEVTLPELYPSLEAVLAGRAHMEERMMLRSMTMRGDRTFANIVLNDVVITKAARARMIDLSVWVGDEFLTRVKADGLIVATPTGSTAYNLAAGGPIVQANMEALIVNPIAPHTLTNRPIVLPADSTVRVQPIMDERDQLYVSFDGQAGFELRPGDEVQVRRAAESISLVRPATRSYFEVLRTKLKWGER
jgi:NAD+ kinase